MMSKSLRKIKSRVVHIMMMLESQSLKWFLMLSLVLIGTVGDLEKSRLRIIISGYISLGPILATKRRKSTKASHLSIKKKERAILL